ncbi:hypothetical protein [Yinghuangia sp. YIM S09857]|uniref:hypothetical protein n=1 Tax=Yinghuangia sp. YIM S09857 TaxID=3436929 RepID=UPI003F52DB3D
MRRSMRKGFIVMAGGVLAVGLLTACQDDEEGGTGNEGFSFGDKVGTGDDTADTGDDAKGDGGKGGSVPKELVGAWRTGSGATVEYQDAITGKYAPPSGSTGELIIKADGSYTDNGLLQTTMYNCTTSLFVMEEGKVTVSGDKATFKPSKVKTSMQNTCSESSNFYNRDGTKNTKVDTFELTQDTNGPVLRLTDEDGASSDYRPDK